MNIQNEQQLKCQIFLERLACFEKLHFIYTSHYAVFGMLF